MRKFTGGAVITKLDNSTLRLILKNPTGEQVFHDLSPAEVEAFRETLSKPKTLRKEK